MAFRLVSFDALDTLIRVSGTAFNLTLVNSLQTAYTRLNWSAVPKARGFSLKYPLAMRGAGSERAANWPRDGMILAALIDYRKNIGRKTCLAKFVVLFLKNVVKSC